MNTTMTICATVCEVDECSLLVCDRCTCQKVLVHTEDANCYAVGDRLCIYYDGIMTRSIPPQINAIQIQRMCRC